MLHDLVGPEIHQLLIRFVDPVFVEAILHRRQTVEDIPSGIEAGIDQVLLGFEAEENHRLGDAEFLGGIAGRDMVDPILKRHVATKLDNDHLIRLLFNGDVDSPLISNIVEDCGILVSIYFADTKVIDDKVYGQLILKLPAYAKDSAKLEKYLRLKKVSFQEVGKNELV